MTKILTVISFGADTSSMIGDMKYQITVNGYIYNVVQGQMFTFDHPSMQRGRAGYISNIQTSVDIDGNITQYIDVEGQSQS